MERINVGCGLTPINGWRNFDNSFSLRLSKVPLLPKILYRLGVLNSAQYKFVKFAFDKDIEYGNAIKGLPLSLASCEVVYSSHMVEHLDRAEADKFLREAYRVLCSNGIIRIAVPDLYKLIAQYNDTGDADAFVEATHMCAPKPVSWVSRIKLLLIGARHHHWMYDGGSLCRLLQKNGFVDVDVMPVGETKISDHGPLDLQERSSESLYVEGRKPSI